MGVKAAAAVLLAACCLAACGGASGPSLPRSAANVAICAALARALDNQGSPLARRAIAGLTFESNAPVSQRLRQEIASYVGQSLDPGGGSGAQQAAADAEKDCAAIHAAVAKAYGGSG